MSSSMFSGDLEDVMVPPMWRWTQKEDEFVTVSPRK